MTANWYRAWGTSKDARWNLDQGLNLTIVAEETAYLHNIPIFILSKKSLFNQTNYFNLCYYLSLDSQLWGQDLIVLSTVQKQNKNMGSYPKKFTVLA